MAYEAMMAECWVGVYQSRGKRGTLHFTVSCKRQLTSPRDRHFC